MQLVSIGGHTKGTCWRLGERGLTLGRDQDNDIVLDDSIVSRRHCRFVITGGRVVMEDLGCRNPLLVNGVPMRSGVLETGDEVTIGGERFLLAESVVNSGGKEPGRVPSDTQSIDLGRPLFLGVDGHVDAEQESPRTIQDLLTLQQVLTKLARCRDREEFTALLKPALRERFHPRALWILLTNEEQGSIVLDQEVQDETAPPEESIQTALREMRGFLSVHREKDGEGREAMSFTLVTPVTVGGTAIGALALMTQTPHGVFAEDDLRL
ncbi:MAG TPA: FHA domain-containing protein, partial [Candidatus Hydrogenedentes bacterium]|nr:FHA domain-containing protein [Candidatus Hydrogenedentota bacterium]